MRSQWKLVVLASTQIASVLSDVMDSESPDTCSVGSCEPSGQALLQVAKHASAEIMVEKSLGTSLIPDYPTNGAVASLDEDGYNGVVKLCCANEMVTFIKRYVVEILKLKICDIGGVAGLAVWHDCPEDKSSFKWLEKALTDGQSGECPWLSPTGQCDQIKCGDYSDETLEKCPPVNPIICCAKEPIEEPSMLERQTQVPAMVEVQPQVDQGDITDIPKWDCSLHPEPIQALWGGDGAYHVSKLEINTGKYSRIWKILPKDGGMDRLNSLGINPIDKRMYATLRIGGDGGDWYLVRFHDQLMDFLGRLPNPSAWEGDDYNAGSFSVSGTYYIAVRPKTHLITIKDIHEMKGTKDPKDATPWKKDDLPFPVKKLLGKSTADIVVVPGKFEGQADEVEYAMLLGSNHKLNIVNTNTQKEFLLLANGHPTGTGSWNGYGAGWNFNGRLFFAHNKGMGVYEIDLDSINLANSETNDWGFNIKKVGFSAVSNLNDGANCLQAPSPWTGECVLPKVDVLPVNGECPPGSEEYKPVQ